MAGKRTEPALRWTALSQRARTLAPGLALTGLIAIAASFVATQYGAPVMLFALLIGMAFHFVLEEPKWSAGVECAARPLLKIGVALLGVRVTLDQIMSLGLMPLLVIPGLMAATLIAGPVFARLAKKPAMFGVLTAGAVAICGASAALAIAAVLPARAEGERDTLFTVVAVTSLSTLAMVAYPPIYGAIGFTDTEVGLLLGATIHDVAQVVGAGYAVSEEAGDVATFVKLLRVALLPVIVIGLALWFRKDRAGQAAAAKFPWFAVGFAALLGLNSMGLIPESLRTGMDTASRWLLVTAIAALGIKTSLKAMTALGAGHMFVVVGETLFLLSATLLVMALVL